MPQVLQQISWFWLASSTIGLSLILTGTIVRAQDSCYMVTGSGQTLNLDRLCGNGSATTPTTGTLTNPVSQPKQVYVAKIKYRLARTPVIDVQFNGGQTFAMILDTGASGTLITRSMAAALNVPVIGQTRSIMADGRAVLFPIGRVNSIAVDGATIQNVRVGISDQADIGLLGHDFFGQFDVKIKQDVVEFYRR